MEQAYAAADLIISRAGAGSVSELCLIGKPVLFIPSPNVAEDHQTKNAQALVSKDAAIMLLEAELEEKFDAVITDLLSDKASQQRMGVQMKALAKPMATATIVDELENILQTG
jgi:UDP-N-acetylglucosamine--N-acetylmuramyl-(pentapeptide) pyrophosphoryl-undecaprenol N-acetylglucosamine transferase